MISAKCFATFRLSSAAPNSYKNCQFLNDSFANFTILLEGNPRPDITPGQFRTTQSWIGAGNASLNTAAFVPTPPDTILELLGDLDKFIHRPASMQYLAKLGIIHAQFETIHPFVDGNGRIGRMLIPLLLVHRGILHQPIIYPSLFLKRTRSEYYDLLQRTRTHGDLEGWIAYFVRMIKLSAEESIEKAAEISKLRNETQSHLRQTLGKLGHILVSVLDTLFETPYVTPRGLQRQFGISKPTALRWVSALQSANVLAPVARISRTNVYSFTAYLELLRDGMD